MDWSISDMNLKDIISNYILKPQWKRILNKRVFLYLEIKMFNFSQRIYVCTDAMVYYVNCKMWWNIKHY